MTTTPEELVKNVNRLATFPEIAFRISETISDENSSAEDIGALIQQDPALSAALLRIANSAMYNIGGTVSSVNRAVTVVGFREIRDLTFGLSANATFQGIPNDLVTVEDFWKHSLYCAAAAQSLGRYANVCAGESLFTAGLLHDIGHLVMFSQAPELSGQSLRLSLDENDGISPHLSERKVFGFDHADVGAELARQWRLPQSLQECIKYHHEPFASDEISAAVLVVHIANSVAVLAELDSQNFDDAPTIDERALKALGIKQDYLYENMVETTESVTELLRILVD